MNMKIFAATGVVFLALPFAASAQGVVGGRVSATMSSMSIAAPTLMTGPWPWAPSFPAKA
jgi:hypothetical protein